MKTALCLLVVFLICGCSASADHQVWGDTDAGGSGGTAGAGLERGGVGGSTGSGGLGGATGGATGATGGNARGAATGGAGGASSVQCAATWPTCPGGPPQHRLAGCSVTADGFSIYKCGWNDTAVEEPLPCRFTDPNLGDPSGTQDGVKIYGCVDEATCVAVLATHNAPGEVTGACVTSPT